MEYLSILLIVSQPICIEYIFLAKMFTFIDRTYLTSCNAAYFQEARLLFEAWTLKAFSRPVEV